MFWFCAALSAAGVVELAICSCLVAETARRWIHRLLPTEKLSFLGRRNHPYQPPYTGHSRQCQPKFTSIGGTADQSLPMGYPGSNGLVPSAVLLIVCWGGYSPPSPTSVYYAKTRRIARNRAFMRSLGGLC
jgi:hypothetical protein